LDAVGSVDADAAVIVDPAALLQLQLLPHHSFSSFQTFYLPFFMDTLLLFSSYFFKGPIY